MKFLHGVASGDPLPTAVVLWTRVTPTPEATPGSQLGPKVSGTWQVAKDAAFTRIVSKGTFTTSTAVDHTVKVPAGNLAPATVYYYRFIAGGVASPTGRTKTAPAETAAVAKLRFGVVSCSNFQAGYFSAYRHLAKASLDAVLHLGDYIYEYGDGQYGMGQDNVVVRRQQPTHEIRTLKDYRQRHALHKTDPDLQRLHQLFPFITTWDDHESANDSYADGAENHQATEGSWAARRAAAHRAYDEWMPTRLNVTTVVGDGSRIYRKLRFGKLAELSMLDLRTYRSDPGSAIDDPGLPLTDAQLAARKLTGNEQRGWLEHNLLSTAQWKLIGNPVMIAPVIVASLPQAQQDAVAKLSGGIATTSGFRYNTDQWDGYPTDRRHVLEFLKDRGITDTLFLTGDIHSGWAADIPLDPTTYPLSTSVATEFVCTSVTSNNLKDITGDPTASVAIETGIKATNRHIKYLDFNSHGYSILEVTPAGAQMDWYVISDRADKAATAQWSTSWRVAASSQTVQQASGPTAGA